MDTFAKLPLGFISFPIAFLLPYIPQQIKVYLMGQGGHYDKVSPRANNRDNIADRDRARAIARFEGAYVNGIESFAPWAAAVLAAKYTGVDNALINVSSIAFVTARILHLLFYIKGGNLLSASLRTLSWIGGLGATCYLYAMAIRQDWKA